MPVVSDLVHYFTSKQAQLIADQTGWCDIDEYWAYASATTSPIATQTITVPSSATSRFQVGDKLRLNNTTTKYFYVISVPTSTTIVVTGGSDYVVTSSAITSIAYSRCERPFGFPEFFNYSPIFEGFSSPPTVNARFCLKGLLCTCNHFVGAHGTSNANYFRASMPIATNAAYGNAFYGSGYGVDNSLVIDDMLVYADGNSNVEYFILSRSPSSVAWSAGNLKSAYFSITYRIGS